MSRVRVAAAAGLGLPARRQECSRMWHGEPAVHVSSKKNNEQGRMNGDVVKVDVVENLLAFLKSPDEANLLSKAEIEAVWGLLAELALRTGDSASISDLLWEDSLPLPDAERLAAHRKVRPEALGEFLCRPDLPPDVLLSHVRREQRPAVLHQLAKKPDLPAAVYGQLAKSQAVSVQSLLMSNTSVPLAAKRTVVERYAKQPEHQVGYHNDDLLHKLRDEPGLHPAAFDVAHRHWSPERLLEVCSRWSGLRPDQAETLLTVAEAVLSDGTYNCSVRTRAEQTVRTIAAYPNLPDSVLDRLEAVAGLLHDPSGHFVELAADARASQAADRTVGALSGMSRTELADLVAAGEIRTETQVLAAADNPVFDLGLACELVSNLPAVHSVFHAPVRDRFVDAVAVSPACLVRLCHDGSGWSFDDWPDWPATQRVFIAASSEALIEALDVARPYPASRCFVELAAVQYSGPGLTDDVVAQFAWVGSDLDYINQTRRVQPHVEQVRERVCRFLLERLGTDPDGWEAFAAIVDCSVPLGAAADVAALAADPPVQK